MSTTAIQNIEDGQFDDAPEDLSHRGEHKYIDVSEPEDSTTEPSDIDSEDEDEDEYPIDEEYQVEDEDWEVAERDFTKQYNRLRQHLAIRSGNAEGYGTQSSIDTSNKMAALPAVNHPAARKKHSSTTNGNSNSTPKDKTTDQLAALAKYTSRLAAIEDPYTMTMGVGVNRKGPSSYANLKDKSDRATNEQVLDLRTRLILFKMIGKGLLHDANVYHARTPGPDMRHLAVKIYKTSILVFKDRDKYVTGEYRFRRGYSRKNPRKMVRLWAEKEMRNLKRLITAGIRCPEPIEVRENVLVMTFLGNKEGWASPRLKDAELTQAQANDLYIELLLDVRQMYHQCKLVHADLSEYNILLHENHLWIIDVSQSVEHDHPAAFDFLRNDLKNVEDFFGKAGAQSLLGLRRSFEFVTKEKLATKDGEVEDDEAILKRWLEDGEEELPTDDTTLAKDNAAAHEDAVFLQSYIPRSLYEVYDPERDLAVVNRGEGKSLIYADTIGLVEQREDAPKSKVRFDESVVGKDSDRDELKPTTSNIATEDKDSETAKNGDDDDEDDGSDQSDDDGSESDEHIHERKPRGHRHEDREAKKERKKAVKAEAKEKRKNKLPKAQKKKMIKKSKGG